MGAEQSAPQAGRLPASAAGAPASSGASSSPQPVVWGAKQAETAAEDAQTKVTQDQESSNIAPANQSAASESSERIVQLAAGELHTLALTGKAASGLNAVHSSKGKVLAWGKGGFGRLGLGDNKDRAVPAEVRFSGSEPCIIAVAAGSCHSLALAADGHIWSWGDGSYGQLGCSQHEATTPQRVVCKSRLEDGGSEQDVFFAHIAAGGLMSGAIDKAGNLWTWGKSIVPNRPDQDEVDSGSAPTQSSAFSQMRVLQVAFGSEHMLVITNDLKTGSRPKLFGWGLNRYGQLGVGDLDDRPAPSEVNVFHGAGKDFTADEVGVPIAVACGTHHSIVVTRLDTGRKALFAFGLGENGQLGTGVTANARVPTLVRLPDVAAVACGSFHTCAVDERGTPFVWGMDGGRGLTARGGISDAMEPVTLPLPSAGGMVGCGSAHTMVASADGQELWAWGRGLHGVLGTGDTADQWLPARVALPHEKDFEAPAAAAQRPEADAQAHTSEASALKLAPTQTEETSSTLPEASSIVDVQVKREPADGVPQGLEALPVELAELVRNVGAELQQLRAENASIKKQIAELEDSVRQHAAPAEPSEEADWAKYVAALDAAHLKRIEELYARRHKTLQAEMLRREVAATCHAVIRQMGYGSIASSAPAAQSDISLGESIYQRLKGS
eukprot:jgi/Chlat1/2244/Chrsp17S02561